MRNPAFIAAGDRTTFADAGLAAATAYRYRVYATNSAGTSAASAEVAVTTDAAGAKVGLCGQAPSDHPEFAAFLVECGIDSISVSPDSFVAVKQKIAEAEAGALTIGRARLSG